MIKRIVRKLYSLSGKARCLDYGKGNCIRSSKRNIKNCKIRFFGNNNVVEISEAAQIGALEVVFLGSDNVLEIDEGVQYNKGRIWYASSNGSMDVGAQTLITEADLTITEPSMRISIGKRCLFAWGIDVRCGDGHPIVTIATGEKINHARPIIIEDHVWIAAKATILKGVTIQANSIVGADTIVTKNVPANSVVAGVPAKVVKEGVTWLLENKI